MINVNSSMGNQIMKSLRCLAVLCCALSLQWFVNLAHAAPPAADQRLLITSVEVKDFTSPSGPDTLIIHGMKFTSGQHDPIVTLHGVGNLFVPVGAVTADTITAELPAGVIAPGDYLLSINTSPAVVDNDTYALTIVGSLDDSGLQRRIFDICLPNSAIRVIDEDGSVVCEVDNDTTYLPGFGLNLVGTTFEVDTGAIQRRVDGTCPSGQAITAIRSNGSVLCQSIF